MVGAVMSIINEQDRSNALYDAFLRTLDRPGLEHAHAGIVLQAYVPDSFAAQRRITQWAARRVAEGGAPVTPQCTRTTSRATCARCASLVRPSATAIRYRGMGALLF